MITALHGTGHGRVLANPKVRVMSGRRIAFVSETQMPILTKTRRRDKHGMEKRRDISGNTSDGIRRRSNLHEGNSASFFHHRRKRLGEVSAPIISERRVETEMLLDPDETIVIGWTYQRQRY